MRENQLFPPRSINSALITEFHIYLRDKHSTIGPAAEMFALREVMNTVTSAYAAFWIFPALILVYTTLDTSYLIIQPSKYGLSPLQTSVLASLEHPKLTLGFY